LLPVSKHGIWAGQGVLDIMESGELP